MVALNKRRLTMCAYIAFLFSISTCLCDALYPVGLKILSRAQNIINAGPREVDVKENQQTRERERGTDECQAQ